MKRIYLAGPMRGYPEFNFPAFHTAAYTLRRQGHFVCSPAEKDIERHGTDISKGNATGDEKVAASNHGFSLEQAIYEDLKFISIEGCTTIALLPGWEFSEGANLEWKLAKFLKREFMYL